MSYEKDSKLESVKLIKYTGRADQWREWSKKVIAYAKTKNFNLALTNFSDPKVTDKMKSDALNFLTMSLSGDAFSFVENADNSGEVWMELVDEYAPSDDNQIFDLQEEFLKCNLVSDEVNPMMWFKRLEYINSRLRAIDSKYIKNDDDLKIHVKSNLPSSIYSELIVAVHKDFKNMLWKDFKSEVRQHWRQWKRNDEKENKENIMMTNLDRKQTRPWKSKQFKGRCRSCGKYGHKAADCPEKVQRENNKKKMRNGHYANKCPNGKKNERNLFVGNTLCNMYGSDDEDMIVTYDSDDDEDEEIILIGEDESNNLIECDADVGKEENDDTPVDMEVVMNVEEEKLKELSMMEVVDEEKNDADDKEKLDLIEETKTSKRMKTDENEWIRVGEEKILVEDDKDASDLEEVNKKWRDWYDDDEKWKNRYGVLNEVENVTNVVRKLNLTPSENESVEKLFDSSDEEEVIDEGMSKKEDNKNIPPVVEKSYMVECDEDTTDDDEISENESGIDLFVKNWKRKRSR